VQNRFSAPVGLLALLLACSAPQGGGGAAATGSAEDEQAVRAIAGKYAAAYSARDTAMFGAIVADDYQAVDPTGKMIQGRAGAVAAAAQEFAMVPAGMTMSMTATTDFVRWIDANHAVAGGTFSMSPVMPGMPSKGSWLATAAKQGSEWKVTSAMGAPDMTGMMPPPPAPAAKP
jgi:ketosteroid isomerase-like protein